MKFFDSEPATVSLLLVPAMAIVMIALALAGQAGLAARTGRTLIEQAEREVRALRTFEMVLAALQQSGEAQPHSRFGTPFDRLKLRSVVAGDDTLTLRDLSAEAWAVQHGSGNALSGAYAYLHPALADDSTLRSALALRLRHSNSLDSALLLIQAWKTEGANPQAWPTVLEQAGRELWPVLSPQAPLNVNLADRQTLVQACEHLWGEGPFQLDFIADLERRRLVTAIDQASLNSLFDQYAVPMLLRQALGVRTWFWEVVLAQSGSTWKAIFCVVPGRDPLRTAASSSVLLLSVRKEG